MATALEQAIDSLSTPEVRLADALRRLLVVARRIGADDLVAWLRSELNGYEGPQSVPEYRDGSNFAVTIRFDGPMQSQRSLRVAREELPKTLRATLTDFSLSMPVGELDALANADAEATSPRIPLPLHWVSVYRDYADKGEAPHMPMFVANGAAIEVPQTYILGVLDQIKTAALDLALGIEDVSGDAGDSGGPTVESEPELGRAVASHMTMIFASHSSVSVASGQNATAVQLSAGDTSGLLDAARGLLADGEIEALAEAIETDGGRPGGATRTFMERVRSGGAEVAGGVAGSAAYEGLVALLQQVFPGFVG